MNEKNLVTVDEGKLKALLNDKLLELTTVYQRYHAGEIRIEAVLQETAAYNAMLDVVITLDLIPRERFTYIDTSFKLISSLTDE